MSTKALPFQLSTNAITDWLQSLSHSNSANSANQLNKVIKTLRALNTDPDKKLKALIQFTPSVVYITANIELSLLNETNRKNTENPRKIETLCIQLVRNLSLALCSVIKKQSLAEDDKNQAIYIAIQLIGYTLRLSSLYHQFPSATLWEKTSELYSLAQDRGIVDQQVKHKILGLKSLPTIADTLKRNILFTLLSPYHHTTEQIIELYSISEKYAPLLSLNTQETNKSACFWDFKKGSQPGIKPQNQEQSNISLNINTDKLLLLLQSSKFSSSFNQDTLEDITQQLSGYKDTINSFLPSAFDTQHIIIGFNGISTFLKKAAKLNKIQDLSDQSIETGPLSTLSLEPMDLQKNHLQTSVGLAATNSHSVLLNNTKIVKIIQTQNERFVIAEVDSKDCALGDIALLCFSNATSILGIIRQIKAINPMTTACHILIEKIEETVSVDEISSPETLNKQIIIIKHKNAKNEVLISPTKISSGTRIKLASNNSFILDNLVDYSPFYMRYTTC